MRGTRSQHDRIVCGLGLDKITHAGKEMYVARIEPINLRFILSYGIWEGQARRNFHGKFKTVGWGSTLRACVELTLNSINQEDINNA